MEITSKQRAYLAGLAQKEEAILHVGKLGLTPALTESVDEALAARELVKIGVQKSYEGNLRELCDTVAGRTHAIPVQVIGRKFVLYRPAEEPKIELPRSKKRKEKTP